MKLIDRLKAEFSKRRNPNSMSDVPKAPPMYKPPPPVKVPSKIDKGGIDKGG